MEFGYPSRYQHWGADTMCVIILLIPIQFYLIRLILILWSSGCLWFYALTFIIYAVTPFQSCFWFQWWKHDILFQLTLRLRLKSWHHLADTDRSAYRSRFHSLIDYLPSCHHTLWQSIFTLGGVYKNLLNNALLYTGFVCKAHLKGFSEKLQSFCVLLEAVFLVTINWLKWLN